MLDQSTATNFKDYLTNTIFNACITFIIHAFIHYNTVMVSKKTFFVALAEPCGLIIRWLGTMFPHEGNPEIW